MIGQRLRIARAASGLSLRGLQERIDNLVTAQAIGKYERDEDMPSSRVLSALARALSVSEAYLLTSQEMVLDGVEFRRKKIPSKQEESFVEGQALHLLERYLAVEGALGLSSVEWRRPKDAPFPISELSAVDNVAHTVRRIWGLGVDPIPCMSELFEERGIKIMSLQLGDIDGLTATVRRKDADPVPVIVVKENECGERKRFTLAHELAHMLLEPRSGVKSEKAANRFAGAFLMPADALWGEIGKHRTAISMGELFELKKKFGASVQAIAYRCRELGIFKEPLFKELFDQFEKQGWRNPPFAEPDSLPSEKEMPKRMERLCFRALAENVISESKAAEILGVSVRALNKKMDQPTAH